MANRIQIRHGTSEPTVDDLLPYELGWYNGTLYINDGDTPSGQNPIKPIAIIIQTNENS